MSVDLEMRVDRSAKTLRELTLEKMRDAILEFRFQPGERLVERTLCERLGVSRTVVREVLRHLEAEGLVETITGQGPAVTRPAADKAAEIYEIRGLLEGEAAYACARNANSSQIANLAARIDDIEASFARESPRDVLKATTAFYQSLFEIARKTVAWSVVQSLNARITHLRAMTISTPRRDVDAIAEMRRIHGAIAKGDAKGARAASLAHIARVAELARTLLVQPKGPFTLDES
jgi:GntR family transcriptional regulator, trigonelline degradation regulator